MQSMWIAEKNTHAIERAKNRLVLIYEGDRPYVTSEKNNAWLNPGTFFGSDDDRPAFYVEL
jgi:hypothetical protein